MNKLNLIKPTKSRKVKVYFNFHKKLFSVVALTGFNKGRVIGHVSDIKLRDCTFKVSESGRQRVLREKRKNVHAWIVGWTKEFDYGQVKDARYITYNPYKYKNFVFRDNKRKISKANKCHLFVTNKIPNILRILI